jgi:hypothetical protein
LIIKTIALHANRINNLSLIVDKITITGGKDREKMGITLLLSTGVVEKEKVIPAIAG